MESESCFWLQFFHLGSLICSHWEPRYCSHLHSSDICPLKCLSHRNLIFHQWHCRVPLTCKTKFIHVLKIYTCMYVTTSYSGYPSPPFTIRSSLLMHYTCLSLYSTPQSIPQLPCGYLITIVYLFNCPDQVTCSQPAQAINPSGCVRSEEDHDKKGLNWEVKHHG